MLYKQLNKNKQGGSGSYGSPSGGGMGGFFGGKREM